MSDNDTPSDSLPDDLVTAFQALRIRQNAELKNLLSRHAREAAQLETSSRRSARIAAQRSLPSPSSPPAPAPPKLALSRSKVPLHIGDIVELRTPGRHTGIGDKARILSRTKATAPSFVIRLLHNNDETTREAKNLELISRP